MFIVRTIVFIFHFLVLLLLLGAKLNAYFPPQSWGMLNLLALGFPILLVLHFIFSFYWIVSFRKRGIIFLLGWVSLMPSVQRWVNYTETKNNILDLKVLTYNSKGVSPEKQVFLNAQDVDILILQECGWKRSDKMKFSNFRHQAHTEIVSVYSKFPILYQEKIPMEGNGYALYADIRVKEKLIRFVNIYLEPFQLDKTMVNPSINLETNKRKAKSLISRLIPVFRIHQSQIEEVKKCIEDSPYPVVLAGDFNAVPNSYEYYTLSQNLIDAFVEGGKGSATSFHDYIFPIRIDYIFVSPNLVPIEYKIDREVKLSDHYPVYSSFYFKN